MPSPLLFLAPLGALAPVQTGPWTVTAIVLEGDPVAGVGNVTLVSQTEVSDTGAWLVEVDTDHADTNADGLLLLDGALYLREGQPLAAPAGASLDSFDSFFLNAQGDASFNFFLDGTLGTNDDSGIYFGANPGLVYQEGQPITAPGPANGALWQGFFETRVNDLDQVLTLGTLDVPLVGTTVDRILLLTTLSGGAVVNEQVIALEGDVLPGQTEVVEDFKTASHQIELGDTGLVAFVADLAGDAALDHALYFGGALIAQEGSPSPIPGRNWSSLSSTNLDISSSGHIVYTGSLDGDTNSNTVIVRDAQKFRQEGDPVPVVSLAAFQLTGFGTGPVFVDESGGVLWFGDWNDVDTTVDTGLFYNDTLLIQEGITVVGGVIVDEIRGISDGYMLSDGGAWATVRLSLVGGIECAVLLRREPVVGSVAGCVPNPGTLSVASGTPALGQPVTFALDTTAHSLGFGLLFGASGPIPLAGPCGLDIGFGEILIDVLNPPNPIFLGSGVFSTGSPATVAGVVPLDESFFGLTLWLQGAFVDGVDPVLVPPSLTNALTVEFGSQP
ncbi:MAG TPA: hypothetical protein VJP77_02900 [Planctomycetota bacterium]|nr:hypothetical protein [Planctomycetota bacterium]